MTNETREILKAIKKEIDAEIEQRQLESTILRVMIFMPRSFVKKHVRK